MSTPRLARFPAVAVLLVLGACGADARATEDASAPVATAVRVAAVVDEELAPPVTGTGRVAAKEEVRLSFKVGGIVAQVLVNEGETVRAGQTLAVLDLREIDAQVARARSAEEKAERDLARARTLYADSVATLEQLQNAATGYDVARAELQAAEFNRRYATIVAPAAGRILRRTAEAGELIGPGVPVLVFGSSGSGMVLRVGVADRDVVRLRVGDAASARFDAYPGERFSGRVGEIAAAARPSTGTYDVEISLDAGARPLVSGLIGRVAIEPSATRPLRLIPVEALVEADARSAIVFTLDAQGTRARRLPIEIAFLHGGKVAVADGLDGVERVVTDGAAYLSDDTAVRVVP
jgi:RND family efflux transporter MFP subunit